MDTIKFLLICLLVPCVLAVEMDTKNPQGNLGHHIVSNIRVVADQGNLEFAVGDEINLDMKDMIASKTGQVSYSAQSLPNGTTIFANGSLVGTFETPGRYQMKIEGRNGEESLELPTFWIMVADENGVIPSYVPPSPFRSVTASPSVTASQSISAKPDFLITADEKDAYMFPPVVARQIPNFVVTLNDRVNMDLSDAFETPKYPVEFSMETVPVGMELDSDTGILHGKASMMGKWRISLTARFVGHPEPKAQLPSFYFIVTDIDGDYGDLPDMTPSE